MVRFFISVINERLQRPPHHRKRRFWRSVRMPKSRHGKNVRDEVPGQKTHQDETGRNFGAQ